MTTLEGIDEPKSNYGVDNHRVDGSFVIDKVTEGIGYAIRA